MSLASLLQRYRDDIASSWAARVRSLPGNGYRGWAVDEVIAWAAAALEAIIESQRTGSARPIEAHATAISQQRAEQRFEIDQVIEGLLLLGEVALPYVFRDQEPDGERQRPEGGMPRGPGARRQAEDGPPRPVAAAIEAAEALHASLRSMAAQFAAVFARAMREQREQVAVLEERNRLARDLHDSVSQAIYGVGMFAEAAARLLEGGDIAAAAAHLREVRTSASAALREMRFLIFELRPPVLREEGLVAALRARLSSVENRAGVQADFVVEAAGRLPDEVEDALYGIAREALNNGLRHARATRVAVRLAQDRVETRLTVRDNGVGFDVDAAPQRGGLGLAGMRERAARIHASLAVSSRPGEGTEIRVVVPREDGQPR